MISFHRSYIVMSSFPLAGSKGVQLYHTPQSWTPSDPHRFWGQQIPLPRLPAWENGTSLIKQYMKGEYHMSMYMQVRFICKACLTIALKNSTWDFQNNVTLKCVVLQQGIIHVKRRYSFRILATGYQQPTFSRRSHLWSWHMQESLQQLISQENAVPPCNHTKFTKVLHNHAQMQAIINRWWFQPILE